MLIIGGTTEGGVGWGLAQHVKKFYPEWRVFTPPIADLDVTIPMSVRRFFDAPDAPVWDYVLYSAGVNHINPLTEISEEDLNEIFQVNVMGYIRVIGALARNQVQGRICSVVGISGRIPMRRTVPYCSSKSGLAFAIKCAAKELGPDWQVTGVAPATLEETQMSNTIDQEIMDQRGWDVNEYMRREHIREPYGRRLTPAEVAEGIMIIFNGPQSLTGSVVDIAGGA